MLGQRVVMTADKLLSEGRAAARWEVRMKLPKVIQAGCEVIGSDGILAGIVDHIEGDSIQLEQAGDPNRRSHCAGTSR